MGFYRQFAAAYADSPARELRSAGNPPGASWNVAVRLGAQFDAQVCDQTLPDAHELALSNS
jgi:hypothetical protein